jgi:Flp pilus assembly protein TadB
MTSADEPNQQVPWSGRGPQKYVLSLIMVILAVALVATGLNFISAGQGGLVPYLIVICAPVICAYYVWYFTRYLSRVLEE